MPQRPDTAIVPKICEKPGYCLRSQLYGGIDLDYRFAQVQCGASPNWESGAACSKITRPFSATLPDGTIVIMGEGLHVNVAGRNVDLQRLETELRRMMESGSLSSALSAKTSGYNRAALAEAREKVGEYLKNNPNATKADIIATVKAHRDEIRQHVVNL